MIRDRFLYELGSSTMDPCSITHAAYDAARATWLCSGCATPKPGIGAIDVHLQQPPKNIAMNSVYGVSIGIIRRDFLNNFPEEAVAKDLFLGNVFDAQGREVPGFATFRGHIRLVIRGDARSSYRRCDVCGRHVYSPMGKYYILSGAPGDAVIYESQIQGLIVREDIAERVKQKQWKELGVRKLPVVETAQDGKPVFWSEEDVN
jgi:hypothetical protein